MITDIEELNKLSVGTVDELDIVVNGNRYKGRFKVEDYDNIKLSRNKSVCPLCILDSPICNCCTYECYAIYRPDFKNVVFLKL